VFFLPLQELLFLRNNFSIIGKRAPLLQKIFGIVETEMEKIKSCKGTQ
jgi:hypothetical protein